jgi:uncharacterized membrane protein (UPF0127 family)
MGRLERLPARVMRDGLVVHEATTLRARLLGLAFLRELPAGHALLIPHCRSVHTFGMRFSIDVAFLDEHGNVLMLERSVPRRRLLSCRAAFAVLETCPGELSPPRPPAAPAEA